MVKLEPLQHVLTVQFVTFRVTTPEGQVCKEKDIVASSTHQPSDSFRVITTKDKSDQEENLSEYPAEQQTTVPSESFKVTPAMDNLDKEKEFPGSSIKQQTAVPSESFSVTTARDKLDTEEDTPSSSTQRQNTETKMTSRVTVVHRFCTKLLMEGFIVS